MSVVKGGDAGRRLRFGCRWLGQGWRRLVILRADSENPRLVRSGTSRCVGALASDCSSMKLEPDRLQEEPITSGKSPRRCADLFESMPNFFGLGLDTDALFDQLPPERVCSAVSLCELGSEVRSKTLHHVKRELAVKNSR